MAENKQWHIFFDAAHQERAKLDSNYISLKKHLEQQGWVCVSFAEFPITRQNLATGDILVFACPDFSKVSPQEIDAIKHWVMEDGGGLLLLSHAGGDKGRRSNLTEVAEQFGMMFENDQVLDRSNNLGVDNLPVINQFPIPHPIIEGISSLCYRAGCSLTNTGVSNISVISSGPDSEPFNTPLILAGEYGEGRVITIGSYEMFRDKITGGIKHEGHTQLASNIFKWLQSSKREGIIQKIATPAAPATFPNQGANFNFGFNENENVAPNITATAGQPTSSTGKTVPQQIFKSSLQINSKAGLTQAFESMISVFDAFKEQMLKEFDTVKNNMQNLMNSLLSSEDIVEPVEKTTDVKTSKTSPSDGMPDFGISSVIAKPAELKTSNPPPQSVPSTPTIVSNVPTGLSLPPGLKPPPGVSTTTLSTAVPANNPPLYGSVSGDKISPTNIIPTNTTPINTTSSFTKPIGTAEGLLPLSPMPSRPGIFSSPAITAPPIDYTPPSYDWTPTPTSSPESGVGWGDGENFDTITTSQTPATAAVPSMITSSDDLRAELQNLEKKIVSISELKIFVQKKFEGGKIDGAKYEKQVKKLESDLSKTKYRIDEIKGLLK